MEEERSGDSAMILCLWACFGFVVCGLCFWVRGRLVGWRVCGLLCLHPRFQAEVQVRT